MQITTIEKSFTNDASNDNYGISEKEDILLSILILVSSHIMVNVTKLSLPSVAILVYAQNGDDNGIVLLTKKGTHHICLSRTIH